MANDSDVVAFHSGNSLLGKPSDTLSKEQRIYSIEKVVLKKVSSFSSKTGVKRKAFRRSAPCKSLLKLWLDACLKIILGK